MLDRPLLFPMAPVATARLRMRYPPRKWLLGVQALTDRNHVGYRRITWVAYVADTTWISLSTLRPNQ